MSKTRPPRFHGIPSRPVLTTIEPLEERRAPATFTVTTNLDGTGDGTLRTAIIQSNATTGPNTIVFAIPDGGVQTIALTSPLPALTQPVAIFGGSQTGSTYYTPGIILNGAGAGSGDGFDVTGGNSTIEGFIIQGFHGNGIVLKTKGGNEVINDAIGTDSTESIAQANTMDGVLINAVGNNAIQNCVISGNTMYGIELTGAGAASNLIGIGNTANANVGVSTGGQDFIGLDVTGSIAIPNLLDGVFIHNSANNNSLVGNVISGNGGSGVHITGTGSAGAKVGTYGNLLFDNYIGTDVSGSVAIGNTGNGVLLDNAAHANYIGDGTTPNANVISGNGANGIMLTAGGGPAATANFILGNYIGTDVSGSSPLGNTGDGILINGGATLNTIGGLTSVNVISANGGNGVHISGSGTIGNVLLGNYIGVDISGSSPLGNGGDGVLLDTGANKNSIGGDAFGSANIISANTGSGVHITGTGAATIGSGTSGNLVLGNFIGTDVTGSVPLGNQNDGIQIDHGANANKIGDGTLGGTNVISGNNVSGILIDGGNLNPGAGQVGTSNNIIAGNYIGTDISGEAILGNMADGILIDNGATNNTIGSASSNNIISGNYGNGIHITGLGAGAAGAGTTGNVIIGNFVGTDVTGSISVPNGGDGILIDNGANANKIGEGITGGGNVLSGNNLAGLEISGSNLTPTSNQVGTSNNPVIGNMIGTDVTGSFTVGNLGDGVLIDNGATGNTVGSTANHNVIAGNLNGIHITGIGAGAAGAGTTGNILIGNYIGTDSTGAQALGNLNDGVLIDNGANGNQVGNGTGNGANVISANNANGIEISGSNLTPSTGQVGTSNNTVIGNFIGTDLTGTVAVGNLGDGVLIDNGAIGNAIGSTTSHNIISGNLNGVHITGIGAGAAGAGTTGNVVLGNYIGTDITGTVAIGNMNDGVLLDNGANANTIGGTVAGSANVISGNQINGLEISGSSLTPGAGQIGTSNNTVLRNYIGTDVTGKLALGNGNDGVIIDGAATLNTIGGATSFNIVSGNVNNGIEITGTGTTGNVVIGNYIGPDVTGANALPNGADGVLIGAGASSNIIGGTATGTRNVISSNGGNGVQIDGAGSATNSVLGNYIGVTLAGNKALPNALDGVLVSDSATGNYVGNASSGAGNVISGNAGNGVEIDFANGNFIMGNVIGTGVSGVALGNAVSGVSLSSANNNVIGGEAAGAGNTIDYSGANGVTIVSGTGNAIEQNSIYASGQLGIDLNDDGVTANTPGNGTTGANHSQNYPVLVTAQYGGGENGTSLMFSFNGAPDSTYSLEIFDSPTANASGYGEGKTPITAVPITITTDASGNYSTTLTGLAGAMPGTVLSVTATDASGNTSEFSNAVTVVPVAPNVDNVSFVVGAHNKLTGLEITFSTALAPASITTGSIEIFAAGVHKNYITPVKLSKTTPLIYNAATDTVTIDTLKPLAANRFYKVFVNGTSDPVTNPAGVALDGEFNTALPSGDGVPGGDFSAMVAHGTSFTFKDGHTNTVSLSLTRGGTMEVIQPIGGADVYLELANVISGKTILSGKVKPGKTGTGVTTIEGIANLDGALDKLSASEFNVINSMAALLTLTEPEAAQTALAVS